MIERHGVMKTGANELRAILNAYKQVMEASWPNLHPAIFARAAHWATASEAELRQELTGYLTQASAPGVSVRIFWKTLPGFKFGGCNAAFARDAGLRSPSDIVGLDDYDKRLPWSMQAAKYRVDDQNIVNRGLPMLDIIERQNSPSGMFWMRVGKTPIKTTEGKIIGLLGMYERVDAETGGKLFVQSQKRATGG
jgi:hypothetical protein